VSKSLDGEEIEEHETFLLHSSMNMTRQLKLSCDLDNSGKS
jgi:hypothetical protein